jgi:transmembrane sensor
MTSSPDFRDGTMPSTAAEWYVRLASEDATDADRDAFARWCEEGSEKRRAYEQIEGLLVEIDRTLTRAPSRGRASDGDAPSARRPASPSRTAIARWAAVLVLGFVGVGGWLAMRGQDAVAYATRVAERRSLELEDGSTVVLNARSSIEVDLSRRERRVELRDGEAFFDVAHAPDRPFVVRTAGGEIRVVGTRFNVRKDRSGAAVTVVEGRVAVHAPAATDEADAQRTLSAGEQVQLTASAVGGIQRVDPERAMAWQSGRIVCDGDTLERVLADLNRYAKDFRFRAAPEVSDIAVIGTFRLDDADSVVRALEVSLGLRRVPVGDTILLVPKESGTSGLSARF